MIFRNHAMDLFKRRRKSEIMKTWKLWILTMAVVAAPNKAMRQRTDNCPMNVAQASNISTMYI